MDGALQAKGLNRAAQAVSGGESMRGGGNPRSFFLGGGVQKFLIIYVSENVFQAILKPFFHIL